MRPKKKGGVKWRKQCQTWLVVSQNALALEIIIGKNPIASRVNVSVQ